MGLESEVAAQAENQTSDFGYISKWKDSALGIVCFLASMLGIVALVTLLIYVFYDAFFFQGTVWLDWQFLTNPASRFPEEAGLYPAIVGSVFMVILLIPITLFFGVGAAIYLAEYAPNNRFTRLININIGNLAGVPSVVWGLLGLGTFIQLLNMEYGTLIAGSLTMSLLILPIVIISSHEAIKAVPDSFRDASYGMGATKWQTIRKVVLPRALPGIMTGTIIGLARAIGETAPLIMIGVPTSVYSAPNSIFDKFTAMTMQLFAWTDFPQEEFQYGVLAAGVVTLLIVMLTLNGAAILIRYKFQNRV